MGANANGNKKGEGFPLWTGIGGLVVGAIVMGAIWGGTSLGHSGKTASASGNIATVDGQTITHGSLENTLFTQYGDQTLQQIIEDRLIAVAAKADHIAATTTDIQNAEAGIEAQYSISGSAELAAFLQQQGMTNAQFQSVLKDDVLEEKLATEGIKVTGSEIAAYYKANKSQFIPSGAKKASPLSVVRPQIVSDIEQSKATPAPTLLAQLAKKYHVTVNGKQFQAVKNAIENPAPTSSAPTSSAPTSSTGG